MTQPGVEPATFRFVEQHLNDCATAVHLQKLYFLIFFVILYYDQQMHNYFTNYDTPTCLGTIVSSSGSL